MHIAVLVPLDISNIPVDDGEWHNITLFFASPSSSYNWFGLQLISLNEGCENAYILIDDVSLEKTCIAGCTNGCSKTDGAINPVANNIVSHYQPFRISNLDNVSHAVLQVRDIINNDIIRNITRNCPNGVEQIEWDGKNMFGTDVAIGIYSWSLYVENDCGSCTFSGTLEKILDCNDDVNTNPCIPALPPEPCCEWDIYLDDVTLSGPELMEFVAVHNIYIATNGPVTIGSDANVVFQAGNEIIVGQYDYIEEQGAEVSKFIQPCNGNRLFPPGSDTEAEPISLPVFTEAEKPRYEGVNNGTSTLSVHPNPSTGRFTVEWRGSGIGELSICNLFGQEVYRDRIPAGSTAIDLGRQAAGMYFLSLRARGGSCLRKLLVR